MKLYTTGEVAERCGITIRTVQYYDKKGIVQPTLYNTSGRRQYDEHAVEKLKQVCLLKSLGLGLRDIQKLVNTQAHAELLQMILAQKATELKENIATQSEQLKHITMMQKHIAQHEKPEHYALSNTSDMTQMMDSTKKTKQFRRRLFIFAIALGFIQYGSIVKALIDQSFKPIIYILPLMIGGAAVITWSYFKYIWFACPACNQLFKPSVWSVILARHTLQTRKLECPHCHTTHFCIEVCRSSKTNIKSHKKSEKSIENA